MTKICIISNHLRKVLLYLSFRFFHEDRRMTGERNKQSLPCMLDEDNLSGLRFLFAKSRTKVQLKYSFKQHVNVKLIASSISEGVLFLLA